MYLVCCHLDQENFTDLICKHGLPLPQETTLLKLCIPESTFKENVKMKTENQGPENLVLVLKLFPVF